MKRMLSHILVFVLALLLIPFSALASGNISELEEDDTISVVVTGNKINSTSVSITNKTNTAVTVEIGHGTWFQSNSSSAQNMLVTNSRTVELAANETRSINVPTACMNIKRDIPTSSNRFTVNYEPTSKLAKLVAYLDENNCSYEVIQAAVWIITDEVSDSTLRGALVNQSGSSVIKQSHIDEARRIIAGL